MTLTLKSYAKLNLALLIVKKRLDGFHELKTIFERIDLHDTLKFSLRKDAKIQITSDCPQLPTDMKNLVYQAALLLQKHSKQSLGADIHIQKRIPMGAGLAGGSSNGAVALIGLNRLWKTQFSSCQLKRWATQMGSDLNFFLENTSFAFATGRGEKISVIESPMCFWHVLITPHLSISSQQAYQVFSQRMSLEIMKESKKKSQSYIQKVRLGLEALHDESVVNNLYNDLEQSIFTIEPSLFEWKRNIQMQSQKGFCFSGSGPSIFTLTKTKKEAMDLMEKLKSHAHQIHVVRTI